MAKSNAPGDAASFGKPRKTEQRDGMCIDWDVPVEMDDGVVLMADVFRPIAAGQYPVIMSHGAYGKQLHFEDGYKTAWDKMISDYPEILAESSGLYHNWEVVDPEKWVPHGYVCVRVDSRGAGRSPGRLDPRSPRETLDYKTCIEWAGVQNWSNGKVGLNGIAYYAINQWMVAAHQPKHLAALCLWEAMADHYRDYIFHGGIYCTFAQNWYDMQLRTVQNGMGARGKRSRANGTAVAGDVTMSEEELGSNRIDMWRELFEHNLDDQYHRDRGVDLSKVKVPMLSASNWEGRGCILVATSKVSSMRRRNRNGSRCTDRSIGHSSTRTTA